MKNSNLIMTGLILIISFLVYQIYDMKQELKRVGSSQPQISFPNGFDIYGQVTGGSSQDGYWLFKNDEKILYYFYYDPETNEIVKTERGIYD